MNSINLIDRLAEEIKKSKNPAVIWGSGILGKACLDHLKEHGAEITGFVVNKKYYSQDSAYGYPIFVLEDYIKNNYCDVIMAFEAFSAERVCEQDWSNIHKLHIYDYLGRFVAGSDKMITNEYMAEHKDDFDYLYGNLEDDASRTALMYFIQQRMMSNYGKPVSDGTEYFGEPFIGLSGDEVYIDCGTFDGDSIELFTDSLKQRGIGSFKKIYAFEPDGVNFEKLRNKFGGNDSITLLQKGVWHEENTLKFMTGAMLGSRMSESDENVVSVPVTSIDLTVKDEKVTFIKMDIEGSEMNALIGAEKTIKRCRPKMAVCMYHKKDDLFVIPKYIKELDPTYKLYLRNYQPFATDLILYAV